MKKSKGITLIALVITIIILIILAGVGISLTLGDNEIFNKAKLAKEKYNEESIREKVELGIMELEIEELALGNQVTIESVLQELLEKGIFETIDKDMAIGNIGEHEVKLKYNEQGKIVIEYIAKAIGVRVTYKLNPESYTNREKVGILLTVNGKVKSVTKPDNLVIYPENETVAINYQVTENGTYKFIIEDEEGNKQEKNVVVDTIDRLPPNDFTITAENIEGGIKIIANTTDAESDGVSVKSGIDRYEYFIKGKSDTAYSRYEKNEITELRKGTYSVYAIAYDKAGNPKTSNTITITGGKILISDLEIGDYIKYNTGNPEIGDNGVVLCRVLYKDDTHGLQIITDKNITKKVDGVDTEIQVTLGGNDIETVKESYNSAIEILNNEAEKYLNTKYAYDARCVGSLSTVGKDGMFDKKDSGSTTYTKHGFYSSDNNWADDKYWLKEYNLQYVNGSYWLASRYSTDHSSRNIYLIRFGIKGSFSSVYDFVYGDQYISPFTEYFYSYSRGFRPCFSIKTDIKITGQDGKLEKTAYVIQ